MDIELRTTSNGVCHPEGCATLSCHAIARPSGSSRCKQRPLSVVGTNPIQAAIQPNGDTVITKTISERKILA